VVVLVYLVPVERQRFVARLKTSQVWWATAVDREDLCEWKVVQAQLDLTPFLIHLSGRVSKGVTY
jgi:hypothetical protein